MSNFSLRDKKRAAIHLSLPDKGSSTVQENPGRVDERLRLAIDTAWAEFNRVYYEKEVS